MKKNGLIRIDEVGRVVLPKEMRKVLKLDRDRLVELYIERDKLIIKRYSPLSCLAERARCICDTLANETGCICVVTDSSKILCVSGNALKGIEGKRVSPSFYGLIEKASPILVNCDEGGKPVSPCVEPEIEYCGLAAVILEEENCPVGAIALLSVDRLRRLNEGDMNLLKISKELIGSIC